MKKVYFTLCVLALWFLSFEVRAQTQFEVGRFEVNGPPDVQYLGQAAQDAIVGTLRQRGQEARANKNIIDPDAVPKAVNASSYRIAGRINAVGNTYRIRLKLLGNNQNQEEYLQISNLNELIPSLENYVDQKVLRSVALAPVSTPVVTPKVETKTSKPVQAPVISSPSVTAPAPVVNQSAPLPQPQKMPKSKEVKPVEPVREKVSKKDQNKNLRGYQSISQRLPFEVRGLAYGDVDGDGNSEVVLTSQQKLYIYHWQGDELKLVTDYTGKKSDYFVKVHLLPNTSRGQYIVLTNLRSNQAASKILKFENNKITPILEEIPYQLRVLSKAQGNQLIGSPYTGQTSITPHVLKLNFNGQKVEAQEKFDLPYQTNLYSFEVFPQALISMTSSGKLQYYRQENSKFEKTWSSRETYGGTGNYVPVEMRDPFNEVVADFFPVPVGIEALSEADPDIFVVQNQSATRNVVGRIPLISDGQLVHLKWDEMGFIETWVSKKVDGSIQDFLVTSSAGKPQVWVAVRLKNPGFLGDVGKNDSVLIKYDVGE